VNNGVYVSGAVVHANARFGQHALINTAFSLNHDNIIGDYAPVSPHATLCGHVEIGQGH
jgi:acyl-[acyl carrier protein]--UDP-N-acetylglucosamine O-acyltransferase